MNKSSRCSRIKELIEKLSITRSACDENELCREARSLTDDEKLNVVQALAAFNVRLAAAFAVRVQLAERQQIMLIRELLACGGSNAIKQFVMRLFSHRLKTAVILKEMLRLREQCPDAVRLMAYYCSGRFVFRTAQQKSLIGMLRGGESKCAG